MLPKAFSPVVDGAAGQKLDSFLVDAIEEFKLVEAIENLGKEPKEMPEIGAKKSIGSLREAMQSVKRAADLTAAKITAQAAGMAKEIEANGDLVVEKMQAEHHETMQIFTEVLGNERAGDDDKS